MNTEENQIKNKSIFRNSFFWWAIIIVPAIIVATYILFNYFSHIQGSFSNKNSDWGNFGSLLSGTFTFIASFAAIATLLEINRQNKQQHKISTEQNNNLKNQLSLQAQITEKQLSAITFEQYDKHRKLFFDQLEHLEDSLGNGAKFREKESLYRKLFPYNSPIRCDYKGARGRGSILSELESLESNIFNMIDNQVTRSYEIIMLLGSFWYFFQTAHLDFRLKQNGDVKVAYSLNENYFNAYNPYDSFLALFKTANFFKYYTGSETEERRPDLLKMNYFRREIIKHSLDETNNINIYHDSPILIKLEAVHILTSDFRKKYDPNAFHKAYHYLMERYDLNLMLEKSPSYDVLEHEIFAPMYNEIDGLLYHHQNDVKAIEAIKEINNELLDAYRILNLGKA